MTPKNLSIDTFKDDKRNFISLKGKTFAEYRIIYHINDCFFVKDISRFHSKYQLLFQKFESKKQQINLLYIDSIFPIILADLALKVFLEKVSNFEGYISAKKLILILDEKSDKIYFKHKIIDFIRFLIYSDISENLKSKGLIHSDRIFCLKKESGKIDFYTIYDQHKLYDLLLEKIKLMIDLKSSTISDNEVNICLKIYME